MTTKTGYGPAFPAHENWRIDSGMTLRDYFAAKAMQALLGNPEIDGEPIAYSQLAYKYADAMLKARKA
jgi:hypothetical protein